MKMKVGALLLVLVVLALVPFSGVADKPTKVDSEGVEIESRNSGCTKIQDGTLVGSDGSVLETGYDQWGYNYQAHMFNGLYCDSYRDAAWCQPWVDVSLSMK